MSQLEITTQDLLLRLGATSLSRSTKADALFRRLRLEKEDQMAEAFMRAPKTPDQAKRAPARKRKRKS